MAKMGTCQHYKNDTFINSSFPCTCKEQEVNIRSLNVKQLDGLGRSFTQQHLTDCHTSHREILCSELGT